MDFLANTPYGLFSDGKGKVVGMIPPDLPLQQKVEKYVELLLPEGENEERVLMGEPALWTRPHYEYLEWFCSRDLEWFSAFCGLGHICHDGHVKIVDDALCANPLALKALCTWTYKTPIVAGRKEKVVNVDDRTKPQKGKGYVNVLSLGPLGLLYMLSGSSQKLKQLLSESKGYAGLIERLAELAIRNDPDFENLNGVAMVCLKFLLQSVPDKTIPELAKQNIIPGLEKKRSKKYPQAAAIIEILKKNVGTQNTSKTSTATSKETKVDTNQSTTNESSSSTSTKRTCANCIKETDLQKCGRCKAIFYCSRECQTKHWSIHKTTCVPK
jgi:hypothetical protein